MDVAGAGPGRTLPEGLGKVERTVLSDDNRGISKIAGHLPPDFCARAARLLREHGERVVLVTGFYVNGAPETDGPPGAAALGHALELLGSDVTVVTDSTSIEAMRAITPPKITCVEFPLLSDRKSANWAARFLGDVKPTAIGFIERLGPASGGAYRNRKHLDITEHCALTHHLLAGDAPSFAVGDGGNETGMGGYRAELIAEGVLDDPCTTVVDELVIASVSNWGALGIVAELALSSGRDLLPHPEMEEARLRAMLRRGAVDGFSGETELKVDGRNMESYLRVLIELRRMVGQQGEVS